MIPPFHQLLHHTTDRRHLPSLAFSALRPTASLAPLSTLHCSFLPFLRPLQCLHKLVSRASYKIGSLLKSSCVQTGRARADREHPLSSSFRCASSRPPTITSASTPSFPSNAGDRDALFHPGAVVGHLLCWREYVLMLEPAPGDSGLLTSSGPCLRPDLPQSGRRTCAWPERQAQPLSWTTIARADLDASQHHPDKATGSSAARQGAAAAFRRVRLLPPPISPRRTGHLTRTSLTSLRSDPRGVCDPVRRRQPARGEPRPCRRRRQTPSTGVTPNTG